MGSSGCRQQRQQQQQQQQQRQSKKNTGRSQKLARGGDRGGCGGRTEECGQEEPGAGLHVRHRSARTILPPGLLEPINVFTMASPPSSPG